MQDNSDIDTIINLYQQSIEWLTTLITDPKGSRYLLQKPKDVRLKEYQDQLLRTVSFLDFIGNPQNSFRSVHIAGTSGKGSVATIIASLLSACSLKTGLHTNPYLQTPIEKFVIDGKFIKPSEFIALTDHIKHLYEVRQLLSPSQNAKYNSIWVAMVLQWFMESKVDWAVIETGMGGRYDPTNAIPASLAVITDIGFDHVEALGPTLEEIASHKAGIIKEGGLVITSATDKTALQVIQDEAEQKGAVLLSLRRDFDYIVHHIGVSETTLSVYAPYHNYEHIEVHLMGSYQQKNIAVAVSAVDLLKSRYNVPLSTNIVKATLHDFVYPGRMEIIQHTPLVILDGAHNAQKMQALVESIKSVFLHKRVIVVAGFLLTKDFQTMMEMLLSLGTEFMLTKPRVFGKLAVEPNVISHFLQQVTTTHIVYYEFGNVRDAVSAALKSADLNDLILVTGSLYMVGEARELWEPTDMILRRAELQ